MPVHIDCAKLSIFEFIEGWYNPHRKRLGRQPENTLGEGAVGKYFSKGLAFLQEHPKINVFEFGPNKGSSAENEYSGYAQPSFFAATCTRYLSDGTLKVEASIDKEVRIELINIK